MRGRLLFLAFLFLSSNVSAQSAKRVEPPKTFDVSAIDAYVASEVKTRGITGLSISIVREGKLVFSKGYGTKVAGVDQPITADTPFAIGSVTKQFICAGILLLAEEGKLSVDDKVSKYFPHLTRADDITLYQLMTHTSGYPDYYPLDFVDRRLLNPKSVNRIIHEYAGGPLDFEPGSRWSYSNTGYLILGAVIQLVSKEQLDQFILNRIFYPVGMKDSQFGTSQGFPPMGMISKQKDRPRGHLTLALGEPEPAMPEADGWLNAAGGIWASAPDIARWDIALMLGRMLKPGSMRLMTTPVTLSDGRIKDYGCGMSIRRDGGGYVLSHGGAVSGFRASNTLIPRTKSAVVVLMNDEQSDGEIVSTIVDLLGPKGPVSDVPKVEGPPAKVAALDFFHQMQAGKLDRTRLGEEFSIYLTDERIEKAAPKLKALGEPSSVDVGSPRERGGLEVTNIRLTFPSIVLEGLMYRSTDGKIEQLLFNKAD